PEQVALPDQARVARIAAGGKRQELVEGAGPRVDPSQGRADLVVIETDAPHEPAVAQADHLRAADLHPQVAPAPRGVRGVRRAEHPRTRVSITAQQAETGLIVEEHKAALVGTSGLEQATDHGVEGGSIAAPVEPDERVAFGRAVADAVGGLLVPDHAPEP